MSQIIENWYVIVALLVAATVVVYTIYRFIGLPTKKQKEKVNEWLIWACIEAEKSLQSGTGQLKLRKVYDAFVAVPSFSWVSKIISFETFSDWVTVSLERAKLMLVSNPDLANYVYGENAETEVSKLKAQLNL